MDRPATKNDGTQQWRDLLFCHWEVPKAELRALLPRDLDVDLFDDRAYVGLVPFKMRKVRPWWLPSWLNFNFYETNVRTYVRYRDQPGVYFFSLDANSRLAVWAAKTGWKLPYVFSSMSADSDGTLHSYRSSRPNGGHGCEVKFETTNDLGSSLENTLQYFLLERYTLFTEHRGQIRTGRVFHSPYQATAVQLLEFKESLLEASGIFVGNRWPDLVHFSKGVDVEVFQ